MKKVLLIVFGLFVSLFALGQNSFNSGDFVVGSWGSGQSMSSSAGSSLIITKTVSTSGYKYFRFYGDGNPCGEYQPDNNGDAFISGVKVTSPNSNCGGSNAWKINVPTATSYVVFKTDGGNDGIDASIAFVVEGEPRTLSSVVNATPTPYNPTVVTATISSAFAGGQGAYLRYTKDNFTTSVVVPMTGSGTTYTADIPADYNIPGVEVKYYAFTSGDNLTISTADADFYTINLNNNSGSNYSYTPTSNINWCNLEYPNSSDNGLVMGQDYIMKSQVYVSGVTNNISNSGNFTCWYGYSTSNTHPDTWTNWVQVTTSPTVVGDNFQYELSTRNLLPSVSNGTFYIATRYQYNGSDYVYGGWNTDNGDGLGGKGGFWGRIYNGTLSVSGKFVMQPISIVGDAVSGTDEIWTDADMYSSNGELFSITLYLNGTSPANEVKFRKSHTFDVNWGDNENSFYNGVAEVGTLSNNIDVPTSGIYLVTFNILNLEYSFTNINCTSTFNNTWNSGAWSLGHVPNFNEKAIFDDTYNTNTNGNISACECQINNGITVTVADNTYFTVAKQIDNDGTIIVENTGNVIQYESSNTNIGDGIYQVKKTAPDAMDYDYIYWSSPLSNADLTTVFAANAQSYIWEFLTGNYIDIHSGTSYPQLSGSTGDGYDDDGNDWRRLTTTGFNNGSTIMDEAKGYIVLVEGSETNPFDFANMEVNDGQDVVFTGGVFNNGTITYSAVQDGITGPDEKNNNLNLIGNPYPSAISADRFLAANSNIGSLYFWTHVSEVAQNLGPNAYDFNNDDYAQYSSAGGVASSNGGTIPTGNIASCQGFMASVADGFTGNITFNNLMRLSVNNNNFYRQANTTSDKDKIWLNLNGSDVFRQILVAFMPETTDQFDFGYDSNRLYDIYTDDFYSVLEDKRLAIQSLASFNDEIEVPLGLKIQNSGNFSISLDHTQGIFSQTQKIYLEDTHEEIIHNLGEGAYTFTQTTGTDINDRFILRFTNTQLGHEEAVLEDLKLYPNPTKGLLNIAYSGSEPLQVTLYNQVGHMVGTYEGVQVLDLSQLAQGMYFAKIANSQGSVTRKIVLE